MSMSSAAAAAPVVVIPAVVAFGGAAIVTGCVAYTGYRVARGVYKYFEAKGQLAVKEKKAKPVELTGEALAEHRRRKVQEGAQLAEGFLANIDLSSIGDLSAEEKEQMNNEITMARTSVRNAELAELSQI
jgi:hypothetical protein